MRKAWFAAVIPAALAVAAGCFVLVLLIVKALWAWTIPDLFPKAVEQGLVAGSISWYTALKLAIFAAVFGGTARASHSK